MVLKTLIVQGLGGLLAIAAGGTALAGATAPGAKLEVVGAATFFVTPGETSELRWKTPIAWHGAKYQISDYWGKVVQTGEAVRSEGLAKVAVKLPAGFYQITFGEAGQEFGVMAQAKPHGPADGFFGIDTVLSWLEKRQDARNELIKVLARTGVGMARERVSWTHINPAPGKWDWDAVNHYQTLRESYASNGIPILEMFHHSPPWSRPDNLTAPYPGDLATTAESWATIGGKWRQYWGGLEIWNEPESNASGSYSGEQYAPTIKTVAYAFTQAGYAVPLGGGVFMGEDPGEYHRTCALNGMLDHVDFVSFHTYHGAADTQRLTGKYRQWLKENGKEAMPLWISESGEPWPAGTDRARQDADAQSAMEIAMKAVEARACGVARYFPFDLPFYVEGPKNFSMMGRDLTPMRSMAAYVQCIAALSGKGYIGDLATQSPVRLARVFGEGEQCTAVIYTGKLDKDATVRVALAARRIEGIDGRVLSPNADGSIPVPDGLVYLHANASDFASLLKKDTEAARLLAISRQPAPKRPLPSAVVLQFMRDATPALHGPDGYLLQEAAARELPIQVRAWNLAKDDATVKFTLKLPGDQATPQAVAATAIPAKQSAGLTWKVDAAKSLDIEQFRYVTITDESGALSPLAIPLRLEGTLEQYLQRHPERMRLKIDDLSAWQKNIAPTGTLNLSSAGEGQWRMDLKFPRKTDQWVYPKFRLPKLEGKRVCGVLLRARALETCGVRIMVFNAATPTYWTSQPIIPPDGQWHAAWVPVGQFDPLADINDVGGFDMAKASAISVGMHNSSASNANTLEVSDLFLVMQ